MLILLNHLSFKVITIMASTIHSTLIKDHLRILSLQVSQPIHSPIAIKHLVSIQVVLMETVEVVVASIVLVEAAFRIIMEVVVEALTINHLDLVIHSHRISQLHSKTLPICHRISLRATLAAIHSLAIT